MRMRLTILAVVIIVVAISAWGYVKLNHNNLTEGMTMTITSPAFAEGQPIPTEFTCQGENVNPPLEFSNVPEKTKSLALIVDDPDAPSGTFDHWLFWNLDPETKSIPKDWRPVSSVVVGKNGYNETDYKGPCPPSGVHHYHFKIYALDSLIDLKVGSDTAELTSAMKGHTLGQGSLVGTYEK